MQADGDYVRAPVGGRGARTIAGGDLAPVKGDGHIELGPGLRHDDRRRQVEADLERILDGPVLVERLAAMELVRRAVGQARVQPNVLLVVREAPERDAQLQLLGHWRKHVLDQLERDVRGHAARGQLGQGAHCSRRCVWKGIVDIGSLPVVVAVRVDVIVVEGGHGRGGTQSGCGRSLPAAPVVAQALRLRAPRAQGILLESVRVIETEAIAFLPIVVLILATRCCCCCCYYSVGPVPLQVRLFRKLLLLSSRLSRTVVTVIVVACIIIILRPSRAISSATSCCPARSRLIRQDSLVKVLFRISIPITTTAIM